MSTALLPLRFRKTLFFPLYEREKLILSPMKYSPFLITSPLMGEESKGEGEIRGDKRGFLG
jgi:hypothetical protein